ncbi:hypothetical protein LO762_02400 [Actinocorallia sp. API 0066]|uniref:hypothetical protein n=1 Tax=Actinocorallia sp. API 0066 TaxID=2896846 RepID=UPI001E530C29|nr:hypothetical protein [Actinocorallia sp. API 0066]MCD0448052.1 hypothetical protein [Actinocorallia sp. API 0066]
MTETQVDAEALLDEAMKKSSLVWVGVPPARPRPAWFVWLDGAAYVLTGGEGEQPLPGLPEAATVDVSVRSKDKGGRLITWTADVSEVEPDSAEWEELTPHLYKARLNAAPDKGPSFWARESYLLKLTPNGRYPELPGGYVESPAVRTVPTPATSKTKRPFMLGGKRRRADR